MAAYEKLESRGGSLDLLGKGTTREVVYIIDGTSNDQIAMNTAELQMPYTFRGLKRSTINLEVIGPYTFEATASYVDPEKEDKEEEKPDTGEGLWSFDTSGETFNIRFTDPVRQRKGHIDDTKSPSAASISGAIGVNGTDVAGTDIIVPSLKLTYRTRLPNELVNIAWVKTVASITGTTNKAPFYGFARGEMLFVGASGEEAVEKDPDMTFTFMASSNIDAYTFNVVDPDVTTVTVSKKGWEYLWLMYGVTEDANSKRVIPKPIDAYVNQVYDESDFSLLGIGTG